MEHLIFVDRRRGTEYNLRGLPVRRSYETHLVRSPMTRDGGPGFRARGEQHCAEYLMTLSLFISFISFALRFSTPRTSNRKLRHARARASGLDDKPTGEKTYLPPPYGVQGDRDVRPPAKMTTSNTFLHRDVCGPENNRKTPNQ